MSLGHPLDALSARWSDDPHPTACAALADGLRKRGDLRAALTIAGKGTERFPGSVPLWLTLARVAAASSDTDGCAAAVGRALEIDPDHPLARDMAAEWAPGLLVPTTEGEAEASYDSALLEETGDPTEEGGATAPELVTESLAALYHRQGHLAMALAAYSELAARDPGNATLVARHEAVREELAATRPVPYDAQESGGTATGPWLAQLAHQAPHRTRPTAFDAFYDPPPAPSEPAADFGAFQRWLEELDK
jgi:hypothetical protein